MTHRRVAIYTEEMTIERPNRPRERLSDQVESTSRMLPLCDLEGKDPSEDAKGRECPDRRPLWDCHVSTKENSGRAHARPQRKAAQIGSPGPEAIANSEATRSQDTQKQCFRYSLRLRGAVLDPGTSRAVTWNSWALTRGRSHGGSAHPPRTGGTGSRCVRPRSTGSGRPRLLMAGGSHSDHNVRPGAPGPTPPRLPY